MEDFIIRIYRFEKNNPRSFVGLVEKVGEKRRIGFTTMDELWEILKSSICDERVENEAGCAQLRDKRRWCPMR
ncbi:MAG TPA: hypothetical protein VEK32_13000 [Thermodesulfobacteriota bacterium]|nr:hypothetical protein [Thermodesulfobacteriota bacterium]